ncbi:MAG: hydrogenase [Bdellovibrionota bacterium]
MAAYADTLLIFLVLSNFFLLGSSWLTVYIRLVSIQGVILCLLTFVFHKGDIGFHTITLAAGNGLLKGLVFPLLLMRAVRAVHIKREIEPLVSYGTSIVIGTLSFCISMWLGAGLPLPIPVVSSLVVPVTLFTILTGLFLIVSRNKAITQVIGYLIMENGIYVFGTAFTLDAPLFVELGILLDIFVGIGIMGIIMNHISREFDSLNVSKLSDLRDWTS